MTEIRIETKTNPHDDKLIDMYSNGRFVMTMVDGCQTKEGQEAIEEIAKDFAKEIDRRIVENLLKACGVEDEPKDDLSDYERQLRFKNKF